MQMVNVRPVRSEDEAEALRMRSALWPETPPDEHQEQVDAYVARKTLDPLEADMLVCDRPGGGLCGFIEVNLRSTAEGCERHFPVGYIEGWYVDEDMRRRGIGALLVRHAERWAVDRGCWDLGSDALLDDDVSQAAHTAIGFEEVGRAVQYRKRLR
jgi:aminoglycoside 6'-N-acetyltransferase I